MAKISESKIHIGDIVQLKAASKAYGEKIPHMVVTEVVKEKVDGVTRFKYHCVWFIRKKVWEFKNCWLTSMSVELIPQKNEKPISQKFNVGHIAFILSLFNELEIQEGKEIPTEFCSPALTIIGFENVKNQYPTFDSNSIVIRETGNLLAKCLYFNPIANKYSEILLPLEVLASLD